MFGLLSRKVVPVPTAKEVATVESDVALLEQHAAISERLGVSSPAGGELERVRFEAYLRDAGLRVYDADQVRVFLTSQYGRKPWAFRPLREADRPNVARWWDDSKPNGSIQAGLHCYEKAIPYPVLLTVERIVAKFTAAKFYVSDERRKSDVSDPFLLVLIDAREYIIERWDEPNYRER